MSPQLTFILRMLRKEVWLKWWLVSIVYFLTAMVFLAAASYWPRVYQSSSIVLVEEDNILSPLMQGTAVTTEVVDRSKRARQIIMSKNSIEKVMASELWLGERFNDFTLKELDWISEEIRASIFINSAGNNLIEIGFKDKSPEKAFYSAKFLTDLFIQQSVSGKQAESRSAYEFIDNQVTVYHNKLKEAENSIKEFRSENVDASAEAKANATTRLIELKREYEQNDLELQSEKSTLETLRKQLTGEHSVENVASIAKENALNERIFELEKRLDELRLNYKDTYPDVIQTRGQIAALKRQVAREIESRYEGGTLKIPSGSIAQSLKTKILVAETNISNLQSRARQLNKLIERERGALENISAVEAEIAELTRDYTVNQNMYQSLLEQRENARISMNIDIEKKGSSIKIQDPAYLPITPKGIRFSHLILAGLVLSFMLPLAVVFGVTQLDQKVRSEYSVYETFRLPVLASVYSTTTRSERKSQILKFGFMVLVVATTWSIYGYAIVKRLQGVSL